ncbi:glycosyl hydrolase 115 family protein [Parapedobacter soli]|uniref:glycosyl hydrolase 115 family protein n=1 Tax=Parapedobacter soli TaxID=416955 RepID=UPI0021C89AAC|nr:glycosyl hydrolase 115 family protein [Parapedobacter soli]
MMYLRNILAYLLAIIFSGVAAAHAYQPQQMVSTVEVGNAFPMVGKNAVATVLVDQDDFKGVHRAIDNFLLDIERVSSNVLSKSDSGAYPIMIGTIGKSAVIDKLVETGKINVSGVAGKWESTLIQVVDTPATGIAKALVVAGSDKRGTIYGIYELSKQIGVSPWHYWADVPPQRHNELYVINGRFELASPKVKYRGIFLNDEAPALSGWATKTFGGFNHRFYEKVFDLILRLKGNFLWPAMWGHAFNDDDPLNPILADEYGVVVGTSHHEPLTRAHDEWRRYGSGEWDYRMNPDTLRNFWKTGLERVSNKEIMVTLGMRGDGDEPMTRGTAIALLEQIVRDQREIISNVTNRPVEKTPQVWALYKEVQEYYDQGMRVPDDVTLLLCDDNWGNLRKLPKPGERLRKGGYGIYYHFDYVGGPRNYKWLNTNPIQKIWEQMSLAYDYGASQLWVINVGDLKPMEFPISFFLDLAWNPKAIPVEGLADYTVRWANQQFGESHAVEIAALIDRYGQLSGRVKPELLDADTYSLVNYNEWERVVEEFRQLLSRATHIRSVIDDERSDAYYQLVFHPIEAMCNLHELYAAHAKNKLYAQQGRKSTNFYVKEVERLFARDQAITDYYNQELSGGKWQHMMDQTHIGYTYWQQPEENLMPKTQTIRVPETGKLGVSIEGDTASWSGITGIDRPFPVFNGLSRSSHRIELFNMGQQPVSFRIEAPGYLNVSKATGRIDDACVIHVGVEWADLPDTAMIESVVGIISGTDRIALPIRIDNRPAVTKAADAFVEHNGYVAMEAPNFTRSFAHPPYHWVTIDNYGKTKGGMMVSPTTLEGKGAEEIGAAKLEFDIVLLDSVPHQLKLLFSPSLDFQDSGGQRFAVAINGGTPELLSLDNTTADGPSWEQAVAENIRIVETTQTLRQGRNTLTYWPISPGLVLQKVVLDTGGLKPSFLGPEETFSPVF